MNSKMNFPKKYTYKGFSCDIKVFQSGHEYIVKFFDQSKDIPEERITNLVIADQGFGYISFIEKDESCGLLSGFLDFEIFSTKEMVENAVDFVSDILGHDDSFVPSHVEVVEKERFCEYNGEYDCESWFEKGKPGMI